jgi:hypothetical protein
MCFQLLSAALVVELHPLRQAHVLSRRELSAAVVVVVHVLRMVIRDKLFTRQLVADVLQFDCKAAQMI